MKQRQLQKNWEPDVEAPHAVMGRQMARQSLESEAAPRHVPVVVRRLVAGEVAFVCLESA